MTFEEAMILLSGDNLQRLIEATDADALPPILSPAMTLEERRAFLDINIGLRRLQLARMQEALSSGFTD